MTPPSTLKMEAVGFFETLVPTYQKTRLNILRDGVLYSYYCENIKSHTITKFNVSGHVKWVTVKLCACAQACVCA